jgi:shikimate dehydrogenase
MGRPYAEVIGDPIGHSKSPLIHGFWLEALGLAGDYRAVQVPAGGLASYLESRRGDPFWRGCNVTAPLKREAAELLGDPTGICAWLGAVNCVFRSPLACAVPANTDLAGIAEALDGVKLEGEKACLIGTGGAAMAALCYLLGRHVGTVSVLARDRTKAEALCRLVPKPQAASLAPAGLEQAAAAVGGARLVVNATPMGMRGGPAPRPEIVDALAGALGPDASVFDMVYSPPETALLAAARARGAHCIDGLTMLVGQAAPAFETFFGAPAPRARDPELRARLAA